jgi:hypothetical protein
LNKLRLATEPFFINFLLRLVYLFFLVFRAFSFYYASGNFHSNIWFLFASYIKFGGFWFYFPFKLLKLIWFWLSTEVPTNFSGFHSFFFSEWGQFQSFFSIFFFGQIDLEWYKYKPKNNQNPSIIILGNSKKGSLLFLKWNLVNCSSFGEKHVNSPLMTTIVSEWLDFLSG